MRPRHWRLLALFLVALAVAEAATAGLPPAAAAGAESERQPPRSTASDFTKSLQQRLKRAGYDPGTVDGRMGPATRQALRQFQQAHGLSPSGDPDIPTLTTLLADGLSQ